MYVDRRAALEHASAIVLRAWNEFDVARDSEPALDPELLATLDEGLPDDGSDVEAVLDDAAAVLDQSIAQARPRFLAYVGSSGLEIGAIGDLLAHSYDPNLAIDAGAATLVETQTLKWVAQFLGYPATSGAFTSGGTISNLTALAAAREKAAPSSRRTGVPAGSTLYCSADAHYSVTRAAELLGIGSDNVRVIATDEQRRMRVEVLEAELDADLRSGRLPIAVVATAGTTLTGAIDPLAPIAAVCRERSVWLHVDGAYGLPAASVIPASFAGLDLADSITVDAHKWMFVPKACGVVMVRDESHLSAAFGHSTNYIPGQQNAVDSTVEYSRPLRALKLWLAFRVHGANAFREAIGRTMEHARLLHSLAEERPGWQVGPSPDLSIALMRRVGVDNSVLVQRLQQDGRVYISHATVDGQTWLRPCFTNPRTTSDDVHALMSVAEEVADSLPQERSR